MTTLENPFFEASEFVRTRSSKLIEETLPPISSSLLLGIVFGAKEDFSKEFFQKLKVFVQIWSLVQVMLLKKSMMSLW